MAERRHSLVPGAVILGLGFVFALDRFGGVHFWDAWYWGLVLGGTIVFVFDRWDPRGLFVALVGLVLWYAEFREVRVRYVWPLLLMALGAFLVARAMLRRRKEARETGISASGTPGSPPNASTK